MKQIIRSVLALTLCALLALASPLALVAEGMESFFAQVIFTLPDGSQAAAPATAVTTTLGDTVYWVDQSMMTPEQSAALAAGQLVVTNDQGEIVRQIPLDGGLTADMPAWVSDPADPEFMIVLMLSSTSAPATPAEADERLYPFGFMTPEPEQESTPEPTEEPTPEPTE
ncbi:MAG: hypothetical protein Q4G52_04970, partial [Clostridia bacterium]|nr:hypothetical protein [Clostridia bacterium]